MKNYLAWLYFLVMLTCLWSVTHAQESNPSPSTDLKESLKRSPLTLQSVINGLITHHPAITSRRFDLRAAQFGLSAAQGLLDPQLNGTVDLSDDLVTLANPIEMGARTPIETRRYRAELQFIQPLRWGTQLSLGLSQGQIETTNPFRNCVPGIISERCYESSLTLSLTQPLLRGRDSDAVLAPEQSARAQLTGAQAALYGEINQLIEQTLGVYLQLSLELARLRLETQGLDLANKQLEEAKLRVDAGVIAPSEIFALEGTLAQRAQSQLRAQLRVQETYAQLESLTGLSLDGEPVFPRQLLSDSRTKGLKSQPTLEDLSHLPEIGLLTASIGQLKAQRPSLVDQAKPQLNLSLLWRQSGLGEELGEALGALPQNESRLYGVTLSYNQALSSRPSELLAQLDQQIRARQLEREARLRQLQLSWQTALQGIKRGKTLLTLAQNASKAARASAEAAQLRLDAGRGTRFEALELQSRAFTAQTEELVIEHEMSRHVLRLLSLSDQLLSVVGVTVNTSLSDLAPEAKRDDG